MFQVLRRYLACYPDPAHREYLRLEVFIVEVPEENEDDCQERFVTVHQTEELPYPSGSELRDEVGYLHGKRYRACSVRISHMRDI